MASTPREHAQHGLREDRLGEADHPGPVMEALVRAPGMLSYEVTWVCTLSVTSHEQSTNVNCFLAVNDDARNRWSVQEGDSLQSTAVDPELTKGQSDRDGLEGEVVARLLVYFVLLC